MATGDGLSQHERNQKIGACGARVYEVLLDHAERHGLSLAEQLQALLPVLQGLAFMMRENDGASK